MILKDKLIFIERLNEMIKLVACDLDGTLFNSDMMVSSENAAAIKAAQQNGIEFLVATGRAPRESKVLLEDAGIKSGFINLNGALVFDASGKLIIKHPIPANSAMKLINLLHDNHFYFEIVTADNVYTEDLSKRITNVAHFMVDLNAGITFREAVAITAGNKSILNMTQVDSYDELLQNEDPKIMKFLVFDHRGHEAFEDVITEINQLNGLVVTSSSSSNIEINAVQAQKGLALLDYAQIKHIKREEIAAIGDNLNDESMIREAGIGVAMGNAVPKIKHLAQITTSSNNDNGVAKVLYKFIDENKSGNNDEILA